MSFSISKYALSGAVFCALLSGCGGEDGKKKEDKNTKPVKPEQPVKLKPFKLTLDIKKGTSDSPVYVSVQKNNEGWVRLTGERTFTINKTTDKISTIFFCNEKRYIEDEKTNTHKEKVIKKMNVEVFEGSAALKALSKGITQNQAEANKRTIECGGFVSSTAKERTLSISSNQDKTKNNIDVEKASVIGSYSGKTGSKGSNLFELVYPYTKPISLVVVGKEVDTRSDVVAYYLYGKNNYEFKDGDKLTIDFRSEADKLEKFTPATLNNQDYTLSYDLNKSPFFGGYIRDITDNSNSQTKQYWKFVNKSSKFSYYETWMHKIDKTSVVVLNRSSDTISKVPPNLAADVNKKESVSLIFPDSSKKSVSFSKSSLLKDNLSMMLVQFKHQDYWLDVLSATTTEFNISSFVKAAKSFNDLPKEFSAMDNLTKSKAFEFVSLQMELDFGAEKISSTYMYGSTITK